MRYRPERLAEGEVQVQADAEPRPEFGKGRRQTWPPGPVGHGARGREAPQAGEIDDAAAHAFGEAEIVGAQNNLPHRCRRTAPLCNYVSLYPLRRGGHSAL